jgi:hypothetical protein
MDEYDAMAEALAALCQADLHGVASMAEEGPRIEIVLSPSVRFFLTSVAARCAHDPARVASFMLDRLVHDPSCLRKLLDSAD